MVVSCCHVTCTLLWLLPDQSKLPCNHILGRCALPIASTQREPPFFPSFPKAAPAPGELWHSQALLTAWVRHEGTAVQLMKAGKQCLTRKLSMAITRPLSHAPLVLQPTAPQASATVEGTSLLESRLSSVPAPTSLGPNCAAHPFLGSSRERTRTASYHLTKQATVATKQSAGDSPFISWRDVFPLLVSASCCTFILRLAWHHRRRSRNIVPKKAVFCRQCFLFQWSFQNKAKHLQMQWFCVASCLPCFVNTGEALTNLT